MIRDVADCPECQRKGIGLVRPFVSGRDKPRGPKLAVHGMHEPERGKTNPRCRFGTGRPVAPEEIYQMDKTSKMRKQGVGK